MNEQVSLLFHDVVDLAPRGAAARKVPAEIESMPMNVAAKSGGPHWLCGPLGD